MDGFRLDLSHGLCSNVANTSVTNLKYYYDNGVKSVAPDAYMILEHWGGNMGTERPQLVNYGMMCWSNTTNAYCQTAMGWFSEDGFGEANKDGYVSYCESHDEERMQYKCKMYGNGDMQGTSSAATAIRLGRVAENVAFNVLLKGSHMLWMWEEIGYDFSINCDLDHPNDNNESYRCNKKPRPDALGRNYFTQADRVAAFTKCAQVITLRTQLMPQVFEGNPTTVSVNSGSKLRKIQWGSNVFVAANFGVSGNQGVTLPSGTWYDYLNGATPASGTYTLAPGELKVFTGTPIQAPTFSNIQKREQTGIETVVIDQLPQSTKLLIDGQIYIRRGDKIYDLNGRVVR